MTIHLVNSTTLTGLGNIYIRHLNFFLACFKRMNYFSLCFNVYDFASFFCLGYDDKNRRMTGEEEIQRRTPKDNVNVCNI
jgi:hypothetical protein